MRLKLHVVLAKTEQGAAPFKHMQEDYIRFFKGEQKAFKGIKKTYEPRPGYADEPTKRENVQVVTTVGEKLTWFVENAVPHLTDLFAVDATNAYGTARATLVVEGINFGELSSLELLHLKSIIESGTLEQMYANIPVRSDAEDWKPTTADQYLKREIFETEKRSGVSTTILKQAYILDDPNLGRIQGAQYTPQTAHKSIVEEIGDYSLQSFSGEYSHRQRAEILNRRSKLLIAVTEALKIANEAEVVQSNLKPQDLFNYLHTGKV